MSTITSTFLSTTVDQAVSTTTQWDTSVSSLTTTVSDATTTTDTIIVTETKTEKVAGAPSTSTDTVVVTETKTQTIARQASTSTIWITETATATAATQLPAVKKRDGHPAKRRRNRRRRSCVPRATATTTSAPETTSAIALPFATNCANSEEFSSACSCIGAASDAYVTITLTSGTSTVTETATEKEVVSSTDGVVVTETSTTWETEMSTTTFTATETELVTSTTTTTTTTVATPTHAYWQIIMPDSSYYYLGWGISGLNSTGQEQRTVFAVPLSGGQPYLVDQPKRKMFFWETKGLSSTVAYGSIFLLEQNVIPAGYIPMICNPQEDGSLICDDPKEGWSHYLDCRGVVYVAPSISMLPECSPIMQFKLQPTAPEVVTSTTTTTTTVAAPTQAYLQVVRPDSSYFYWGFNEEYQRGQSTELDKQTAFVVPPDGGQPYMVDQPARKMWFRDIRDSSLPNYGFITLFTDEDVDPDTDFPVICNPQEDGSLICNGPREGWSHYFTCGFMVFAGAFSPPEGCSPVQFRLDTTETELVTSTTTTTTTVAPTPTPV
jgi:hypothetical protein